MKVFYWVVLLIAVGVAIFTIQNSSAPLVTIKFLFWQLETSLIYTILASIGLGIVITLLFWIPGALRSSFRRGRPAEEPAQTSPPSFEKRQGP